MDKQTTPPHPPQARQGDAGATLFIVMGLLAVAVIVAAGASPEAESWRQAIVQLVAGR